MPRPNWTLPLRPAEIDTQLDCGGRSAPRETGMGRKKPDGFPRHHRDPEGTKARSSPLCRARRHRELCQNRASTASWSRFIGPSSAAAIRSSFRPARLKTACRFCRKRCARPIETAEFFKEYTKLTGLKAEPQMPEELEQTIRDMPRDREAVELFKKLTGPDPLPQR